MAPIRPLWLLLAVVALGVFVSSISPALSQTIDPQSLVGEWTGHWENSRQQDREFSGFYSLKIEAGRGKPSARRRRIRNKICADLSVAGHPDGQPLDVQ